MANFFDQFDPATENPGANFFDQFDPAPVTPTPSPTPAATPVAAATPTTYFSKGTAVGGPDEMNDPDTNRGYSATGPNLTPGVAAVNTRKFPLGSILRDANTGEVFIAADKHGNRNPNVVDLYVDPEDYQRRLDRRDFEVVGQVAKADIPKTPEGVRALLASYGTVPGAQQPTNFFDQFDQAAPVSSQQAPVSSQQAPVSSQQAPVTSQPAQPQPYAMGTPQPPAQVAQPPPPGAAQVAQPPPPGAAQVAQPANYFDQFDAPVAAAEPSRLSEFGERVKRGIELGTQDVKAGIYQQVAETFRGEVNPYQEKSQAQAQADVPKLQAELATADKQLRDQAAQQFGADYAKALTPLEFGGVQEDPSLSPLAAKVRAASSLLAHAQRAAAGDVSESFGGSLSRAAQDLAQGDREAKVEIAKKYVGKISPARDKEFWMQVADSTGQSIPSSAAAMLNPAFGLALMGAQTYNSSYEEYLAKHPKDVEGAHEFAKTQMILQTPLETFGDVAFARLGRTALKSLGELIKGGATPQKFARWITHRAVQWGEAAAGETFVTNPAQQLIEQTGSEAAGLRAPTTFGEKVGQMVEAGKIAAGQSLLMGGGPVIGEAAGRVALRGFETKPSAARVAEALTQLNEWMRTYGENATVQQVAQGIADELQKQWKSGPSIQVVQTTEDAAAGYSPETAQQIRDNKPEAFYDKKDGGKVVLVAENFLPREGESLPAYVRRNVMHEAVGHGGIARLFEGPWAEQYGQVINGLYQFLAPQNFGDAWRAKHGYSTLEELARWYGYDWTEPEGIYRTIEEHLARLAEEENVPRWYHEVINKITYILRSMGMSTWTSADTRVLLARARDQLGKDRTKVEEVTSGVRFSQRLEELLFSRGRPIRFVRSLDTLTELAKNEEAFKDWYTDFAREIDRILGEHKEYAPLITELLAALSPQNEVIPNVTRMIDVLGHYVRTGEVLPMMEGHLGNVQRALRGEPLSGPKVGPFTEAMHGDTEAMAIDRHVAMLLFDTKNPSARQIVAAKRRIRQIATRLGWTPSQAQAAIWAANIRRTGEPVESFEKEIERQKERLYGILAEDKAGEGRGIQAARRISERIGARGGAEGGDLGVAPGLAAAAAGPSGFLETAAGAQQRAQTGAQAPGGAPRAGGPRAPGSIYPQTRTTLQRTFGARPLREFLASQGIPGGDPSHLSESSARWLENQRSLRDAGRLLAAARAAAPAAELSFSKAPEERQRGFIESVKAAENVLPTVRERVEGVYTPLTNKATVEAARTFINAQGEQGAFDALMRTDSPTARDYAAGIELIGRFQAAGRLEQSADLIERMAERATTQGQAIQALSLLSKLTAEGIQVYAQRLLTKAIPKMSEEAKKKAGELSQLRQQVRALRDKLATYATARAKPRGSQETVQTRLNRLLVANPNTSIWGRYKDSAVRSLAAKLLGPSRPRGIPALEAFTARLVRQLRDQLPGKPLAEGQPKHPELDEAALLGEAVNNFEKYKEVWEEAQRHVADLFKDHPEALESLDDYFGQILRRPFSERSVQKAVSQVLGELNVAMGEVLKQGISDKAAMRKTLQDVIVDRAGVSAADAHMIAEAVAEEFDRQLQVARDALLKRMSSDRTPIVPKSQLEKLIGLNNAGALDDARFFAALAKTFGLPAWTPELSAKVQRLQKQYELATDPDVKLAMAAQMFDAVHSMLPSEMLAKVRAVQNISLLLNPRTVIRNILGNGVVFLADQFADGLSRWAVDPFVGLFTGKRTRRSVDVAARWTGVLQPGFDAWKGYQFAQAQGARQAASVAEGVKTMLTLARLTAAGKYDIGQINKGQSHIFSSTAGRLLEDTLGLVLGAPDRAFHQAAFKASLMRQMALAQAEGRAGDAVSPTLEMIDEALMDAARAVFQDENRVSKGLAWMAHGLNYLTTGSKEYGLGSIVLPFTRVPGSILLRGIEYSPLGFIRALYEGPIRPMLRYEFRQKEFVDAFSRAAVGTVPAALGYFLFRLGIAGALPDEDDDLEAMRQASGLGKFTLNVSALKRAMLAGNFHTPQLPQDDDVAVNYDWLQPNAFAVALGAAVAQQQSAQGIERARGKETLVGWGAALAAGAKGGVMSLESQPLLVGFGRWMRTAGEQGPITGTAMQALNAPGMFVPTFVRQSNDILDNQLRETRAGPPGLLGTAERQINQVMAKIPGLSARFPARYDVYGEAMQKYSYGGNSFFNVMVNPAFVDRVKHSKELNEMERIYSATGERRILPERAPTKIHIAGQEAELDNKQISEYQQAAGTMTLRFYGRLAASPEFAKLPPGAKAAVLTQGMEVIHQLTVYQVLGANPALKEQIRQQYQDATDARVRALSVP